MEIKENVLLAPYTTFGIGGAAFFFLTAQSIGDIEAGLKFAEEKGLPIFILGGGSNLLVSDAGFKGVVIKVELKGVEFEREVAIAASGEGWDKLVAQTVDKKLWGLENLSGILGTVGGAVVQNIGAYGAALSESLIWVEAIDSKTREIKRFTNAECSFDYRDSFFKHNPQYVVIRAAFVLSPTPTPNTSYKDLAKLFNDSSTDLQAIRTAVLNIRKGKFPDLAVEGTAGSFFKNPILPVAEATHLKETYPLMPLFEMPETAGVKVPLAWLLDNVLKLKGLSVGGARLYEKQPLVIAAQMGAAFDDIKTLAAKVKEEVKEKLQITIEEEVTIL